VPDSPTECLDALCIWLWCTLELRGPALNGRWVRKEAAASGLWLPYVVAKRLGTRKLHLGDTCGFHVACRNPPHLKHDTLTGIWTA
jgi:hypothetical protein